MAAGSSGHSDALRNAIMRLKNYDEELAKLERQLILIRRAASIGSLLCFEDYCCPVEPTEKDFFKNAAGLAVHLKVKHDQFINIFRLRFLFFLINCIEVH